MKNIKNNPFLVLFTVAILLMGILFYFVFISTPGDGLFSKYEVDTQTLQENYSEINQITPGSSTMEDVKEINGEPTRTEVKDEKTYMYYPTPFEDDGNVVVINDGVVEYAFEYVFGEYRGISSDFIERFGAPSLEVLSNISSRDTWYVFLNDGVMVMTAGDKINAIAYFIPMDENSFLNSNLANDLGVQRYGEGSSAGGEVYYGPNEPDTIPEP